MTSLTNSDQSQESYFGLGGRLSPPTNPLRRRAGTPIVTSSFSGPAQFLHAIAADTGPAGELGLDTRASYPRGSDVVLEVRWPGLPNRVYLRARVRRNTWTGRRLFRLYPGERRKIDFLVGTARGELAAVRHRSHRRYCVRLPLSWRPFGAIEMHSGVAEDLSATGVRLVTAFGPIKVGERAVVRLQLLDQDIVITGAVRYVQFTTWDEMALGVVFAHRASGEQRSLRCLLHSFAAKGMVFVDQS